jgi:hypothetical protein
VEPHPYRQAFEARDLDQLVSVLADDVSFHSPVVSELGFEGRDSVAAFLPFVLDVFEDNQFTHDLGNERSHVLVANARVLGKPIKTTWLLEFDAEGKIREIWVMVRPLTALIAIAEAGGRRFFRVPGVRVLSKPLAGLAAVTDRVAARLVENVNRATT